MGLRSSCSDPNYVVSVLLFDSSTYYPIFINAGPLHSRVPRRAAPTSDSMDENLPLGLVFATFMMAMMIGARMLDLYLGCQCSCSGSGSCATPRGGAARRVLGDDATGERCRLAVTAAFGFGALCLGLAGSPDMGVAGWMDRLVLFSIFEVSVGCYYPSGAETINSTA